MRRADLVCAYKPQFAHYAAYEAEDQLERTIEYIHQHLPGRAGDPRRQARRCRQHRRALRDRGLRALRCRCGDGQSLPRHGFARALPEVRRQGRHRAVPHLQSRRAGDLQDLDVGGRKLYQVVAQLAATRWNSRGNCLLVVGATYPQELAQVRALIGDMPFLVPGVGAQGGGRGAGGAGTARPRPAPASSSAPRAPSCTPRRARTSPTRRAAPPWRCASRSTARRHARVMNSRAGALAALGALAVLARLRAPAQRCSAVAVPPGAAILVRGGGPEPDSLDPQKAARLRGAEHPARPVRGPDHARQARGGGAGRRAQLERERRRPAPTPSSCGPRRAGPTAIAVVAADFVAALQRLVDPATASGYAAVRGRHHQRRRHRGRTQAPRRARRRRTRRGDRASSRSPRPRPICRRCCRTRAPARCTAPRWQRTRDGYRAAGRHAGQRRLRAQGMGAGLAHPARCATANYWDDAATRLDGVKYLLIPDENAELARYRSGELQVTFVVPRGQFDWIKANLAGELHVAPQLTTYYYGFNLRRAPFKDQPRAAARAVARHRSRQARAAGAASRRAARLRLGAAGHRQLQLAVLRLPRHPHGASASREAQRLYARPATRRRSRCDSSCATTPARCTPSWRSPSPPCGRRRSASQVTLTQVEFKSLLQDIDRGDVEMFRSSWVGDYNDAYTFAQYLKSDFGVNLPHYASAAYDALLDARRGRGRPGEAPRAARAGRAH